MTLEASSECVEFRRALRDFVGREITPHVAEWEAAGVVPREVFHKLGSLGYLGIRLSEESGGAGLDFRYTAIMVQELVQSGSIGVAVSVLAHAEFASKIIDLFGSPELKETFIKPGSVGKRLGALGVTEPGAGSDVANIQTRAVRDGDDYVINGSKTFISNGNFADFVTTAVRTGGDGHKGISIIVIPTDTPGFSRGKPLRKIGTHASDTAELTFDDCRVPARYLVGEEGKGFRYIMQGFEGERLVLAIMAVSQMRMMWKEAHRYGHERVAFGQPLLGFQVWRHRLADVLTTIEAADALNERAIEHYVAGKEANSVISMAKLFATEAVLGVAHECAQIFGGNGYMEEFQIARMFRDSLAFTVGAGSSEMMREIIARCEGLEPQARR